MDRVLAPLRGWAPALVGGLALAVSGGSTYWDIASHVDGGRERFLTPPHIGIYSGVTVALAVIALALLADRLGSGASLRDAVLHPFREVRPGLAAAGVGMATALAAAPFDNAWHEIYGIDITIWSPPHLLAIFGVSTAALGLAMLVSPASRDFRPLLHHFLLASFLAGLVLTTGEYEFNGPQYRIAYHPIILATASTLVFVAAARGPLKWSATRVALFFEATRLLSLVALVGLDHSLPFVPLVLPAAVLVDLLVERGRLPISVVGACSGISVLVFNWVLLEMLDGIRWLGDDFVFGALGALTAGAIGAWLGSRLGDALVGAGLPRIRRRNHAAAATVVLLLMLIPGVASAHEVGGDAGEGLITWEPARVAPGQEIRLSIHELQATSGASIADVRAEIWRAEHRIRVSLRKTGPLYEGSFTLPEEGPWMMLIWVEAGDESLLSTQRIDVEDRPSASTGVHRERFTLGLDTLAENDPPAWLDVLAYGVAVLIAFLLLRGLVRSLRRLTAGDALPAASVQHGYGSKTA